MKTGSLAKGRSERGLSLVEVLVAVVILAIGLLGIASTQLVALEQTNLAHKRTTATMLVSEMADRVRANNGDIPASVPADLQRRMDDVLGTDADMDMEMNDDMLEVTLEWKERDRFEDDGERDESFTMQARMNND
ncbi:MULTISPECIES: type IV pilus modification protein PilV [Halomonadaceae]|uniref:Type IV pilus modification protein PilV n=1 Tax=Vreelandella halophila TaxID=86177 RepID=A0A9X4YE09_9GAMM|nr:MULTISPECIES: type IV pilus modification protein PilV [Halomonas]MYL27751.1 type IV pilus modification protein PilV [Halomonas utahensis]MYL75481.1 type IV pilus modification protein PilV [Halomonas sp. 22501_18_FS]